MDDVSVVNESSSRIKFSNGSIARDFWSKPIINEDCSIEQYNPRCGNVFSKMGQIVLDDSPKRQTTIKVDISNDDDWKLANECVYLFTRNNKIMKIGGTRTSMKERWGSYLCGHCVPQRINKNGSNYPGKMSVTNAYLYHTIEKDLLDETNGGKWEIYTWKLTQTIVSVDILGISTDIIAQTYHAYESRCINLFNEITGHIPQFCDNADPKY